MADPQLIATGKVRDIYATSDPNTLLFVASDRVSAFDVVMQNVRFQNHVLSQNGTDLP